MAETPWLLIAFIGFLLLLFLLRVFSSPSDDIEDELEQLQGYRRRVPLPTTEPISTSSRDWSRRRHRLAHMGAPSPGAGQPAWLSKARQEAGLQRPLVDHASAVQAIVSSATASNQQPQRRSTLRIGVYGHRPYDDDADREAEIGEWLAEEYPHDEHPHDTDWDDHDVDYGETR